MKQYPVLGGANRLPSLTCTLNFGHALLLLDDFGDSDGRAGWSSIRWRTIDVARGPVGRRRQAAQLGGGRRAVWPDHSERVGGIQEHSGTGRWLPDLLYASDILWAERSDAPGFLRPPVGTSSCRPVRDADRLGDSVPCVQRGPGGPGARARDAGPHDRARNHGGHGRLGVGSLCLRQRGAARVPRGGRYRLLRPGKPYPLRARRRRGFSGAGQGRRAGLCLPAVLRSHS